jgi:hypothetical protein
MSTSSARGTMTEVVEVVVAARVIGDRSWMHMSTRSIARGAMTEVVEVVMAAMVVGDTEPDAVMEMAMVNITLDLSRAVNQMELVEVTIPVRVVIVVEGMDVALDAAPMVKTTDF